MQLTVVVVNATLWTVKVTGRGVMVDVDVVVGRRAVTVLMPVVLVVVTIGGVSVAVSTSVVVDVVAEEDK